MTTTSQFQAQNYTASDFASTARILNEHGVRPSIQRLAVYQYLKDHPVHPTADSLYLALSPSIPTLSKTTVYNTLKLLEKKRLLQSVAIENDELRYDAETREHWHFKCTKCGQIYDIFSEHAESVGKTILSALPQNFAPHKLEMNMRGLCDHCSDAQA